MLNEIEKVPIVKTPIFPMGVGKFAERLLYHLQHACNGECSPHEPEKMELIAGAITAAYELGLKDGVERSVTRIKQLLTAKG